MAFQPLVTVAGTALPEPAVDGYKANTATLVDSARNVEGVMIGEVIRDDVAKVELNWKFLTVAQWAMINGLFKDSSGGKFINAVTFLDQSTGAYQTRQMYVSDRSAGAYLRDRDTKELRGWTDCRIALIEV